MPVLEGPGLIGAMEAKRGHTVAVCFLAAALIALLAFGLTLYSKKKEMEPLRAAPPPAGGGNRVTLGILVDERADGSVYVLRVLPGGAAENAGFRPGDVIRGLAGYSVKSVVDMASVTRTLRPGATVSAVVVREGKETVLSLTPRAGGTLFIE